MATAPSANPVIRFSSFELNTATSELRKSGMTVKLRPQAAKILSLLAARPGELVSREELREKVWGVETFVDFEHGLNLCIQQIRAALDDDATTPRYIETLPRRGYRFVMPVADTHEIAAVRLSSAVKVPSRFRFVSWRAAIVLVSLVAMGTLLALLDPGN